MSAVERITFPGESMTEAFADAADWTSRTPEALVVDVALHRFDHDPITTEVVEIAVYFRRVPPG